MSKKMTKTERIEQLEKNVRVLEDRTKYLYEALENQPEQTVPKRSEEHDKEIRSLAEGTQKAAQAGIPVHDNPQA